MGWAAKWARAASRQTRAWPSGPRAARCRALGSSIAIGTGGRAALIDEFSVAGPLPAGLVVRPLAHPTSFRTFVVLNAVTARSIFADRLIELLRAEMRAVVAHRAALHAPPSEGKLDPAKKTRTEPI